MARIKVRKAVEEAIAKNPKARIDVLYDPNGGWGSENSLCQLPESDLDEYEASDIRWYGDNLCVIEAS